MKFLVALVIVCSAIGYSEQGISKEEGMEMFKKMATDCMTKEGATSADLDEAFAKKMPSTATAKCLHACIGETMGMMKDNKVNVDGVVALAKMAFDDDAGKLKTAESIATDCVGITDGNRCEASFKILECTVNAHKSRGLQFGEW